MLFRTFDPYYNDEISNNICFICYEIECESGYRTIKINSKKDYIKNCKCNVSAHNNCLSKWYEKSSVCPICRKIVNKKININFFILKNTNKYYIFIFNYLSNNFNKIIRAFFTIIFIYYTCEYYLFIFNQKYNNNIYKKYYDEY